MRRSVVSSKLHWPQKDEFHFRPRAFAASALRALAGALDPARLWRAFLAGARYAGMAEAGASAQALDELARRDDE
jgi:hypothetical protein